ncbi:MAG: SHOCT domain-containing protein [Bacteroidota bacterium]|nr:SHOCT domain-containing protein [Bacteroidota bacterium]
MHMYDGYHFWGMHLIWWFIWGIFLFWIFFTPYNIPGQQRKRESPLDIIKRRYNNGEINQEEYQEMKNVLESDSVNLKAELTDINS